jgi:hypothetical protein
MVRAILVVLFGVVFLVIAIIDFVTVVRENNDGGLKEPWNPLDLNQN